jgi:inosose dehydratase
VIDDRIGAGPISWGVCEVPGWGIMLPADRVLDEMAALGIHATELGAPGFLPDEAAAVKATLDGHGMRLIGGFVPLVLHDPNERDATLKTAQATADVFVAAGGDVFVSTPVASNAWSEPFPLDAPQWAHLAGMLDELDELCADRGLVHALHPHVGTLVERRDDVRTVLERSAVRFCLDTGHLTIGGYDPVEFVADAAGRVAHVHLKDVRDPLAAAVRDGTTSLLEAVRHGLFCPLGDGDAPVAETIERLERDGYNGWYVLEQDTDLGATAPSAGSGPIDDVRTSADFVRRVLAGTG